MVNMVHCYGYLVWMQNSQAFMVYICCRSLYWYCLFVCLFYFYIYLTI